MLLRQGLGLCVVLCVLHMLQAEELAEDSKLLSRVLRRAKDRNGGGCRYRRVRGEKSKCVAGEKTIKFELRKPKEGCEPTKTEVRQCKVSDRECYDMKGADWSDCDRDGTQEKTKTVSLKADAPEYCKDKEPTKTIKRPCKKKRGGRKKKKRGCNYVKGEFSKCEGDMKTRIDKSDKPGCPDKTITRACNRNGKKNKKNKKKKRCKYTRGTWSTCANGKKERTDTLNPDRSTGKCRPTKVKVKNCDDDNAVEP